MRPRWWWATILARLLRKIGKFNDINACASIIAKVSCAHCGLPLLAC